MYPVRCVAFVVNHLLVFVVPQLSDAWDGGSLPAQMSL